MQLPKTSISKKRHEGFTLMEMMLVIGIMTILLCLTLYASFENLQRDFLFSERDTLVSLLEKARNEAQNDIDAEAHGVEITGNSFFVFSGNSFDSNNPENYQVSRNRSIYISSDPEIIFSALSGSPKAAATILLSNGYATSSIAVTSEGIIK